MAEENKENNSNEVLTVLKTPILLAGLVVVMVVYLFATQVVPKISEFVSLNSDYKAQMASYADKERTLEELKSKAPKVSAADSTLDGVGKSLFRPLEAGMDTESIIASEFNEILSSITANSIKTRSVKYTYDPQDDNFVKGNASKYSVCKLDMEMIATYTNFKNFMKDLYKHEHYLDIAKVEIVPYQKNKTILLINLQLKLYAQKV